MAATELKAVYLITGADRPKIQRALRRLRDRIGDDATELRTAHETSGDDAVAACNSLGLLGGGGRLVIVEDVDRWKAADTKSIAAYLASPAPDTVLALVASELKKDSALAKACAKVGDLLVYDVPKRRMADWVAKQFGERGVSVDAEAARLLIEVVGEDPEELASEVDKIATWSGGEPVGTREIELLAAGCAEVPGYELTDAWGRRDLPGALGACQTLLERSGDPVSRTVPMLIGLLVAHVGRVRDCQVFAAEGLTAREAASRLKRHPFYVEKLYAQARNYGPDELRDAVVRLAELDHAVKGGSRLTVDLELERALVEITRPRETAAA
ncbi:MAG: DNA polymerase III subunit delta [Actinobacteria bacterium 13_1_20CM_4_69_9]|nr:MAG: DNA polymerase III subunit delta [Actinobacteria bacterium 13_1_20CM_4_69_9]